jgi:hypothetical protein
MVKYLIVLLLLFSGLSNADSNLRYIHLGMVSKHFNGDDYNETHDLIALDYKDYTVGYYTNSYYNPSYFIVKNRRLKEISANVHLGFKYGIIYGYDTSAGKTVPFSVPSMFFDFDPVGFDINYAGSVVSLQLKFKF